MLFPRSRPHRDDALIALAGLFGGLVLWAFDLYTNIPSGRDPGPLPLVPLVLMCVAELLRRTSQPFAVVLATGALVADQLTGSLLATVLMFTDVVYAAVLYGPPRYARKVAPVSVFVTIGLTITALAVLRRPEALVIGVVVAIVSCGPAWTGEIVRQHRDRAAAERLRADQTALLAELDRREAVAAERSRMARELHDMVANNLSAIAIHSTAALSIDKPGIFREALGVIRENSVQGLSEMRRLIGLLREPGDAAEQWSVPSLDALDVLLEQSAAAGRGGGLSYVLRDERPEGVRFPAPVGLAAYRIVQESLTNTLKHAGPGEVAVSLRLDEGVLRVTVDSPYGAGPSPRAPGSGAGLIGMRERAELLNGSFEAGRRGTVWRVSAALPVNDREENR